MCNHWTHMSTEQPCGGSLTSCLSIMVLPRGVCPPLSRPSVGGSLMPFVCHMSTLASSYRKGSRLTPPKVWQPPRPTCRVWLCRTYITLRVGLHHAHLSDYTTLIFVLLLVPPSSCRSCAEVIHTTQGLESLAAWASRSQSI